LRERLLFFAMRKNKMNVSEILSVLLFDIKMMSINILCKTSSRGRLLFWIYVHEGNYNTIHVFLVKSNNICRFLHSVHFKRIAQRYGNDVRLDGIRLDQILLHGDLIPHKWLCR